MLEEHLGAMPPEARRAAELLVGDVARLRALVEDLTNLASLDAGASRSVRSRSTSRPSSRAPSGVGDGTGASTSGRRPIVPVVTDRNQVDRIVANLIGNALDHGRPPVEVRVSRNGSEAVVEVEDASPWIAPEHLEHVFDRFYRADAARSGPGTGLGSRTPPARTPGL